MPRIGEGGREGREEGRKGLGGREEVLKERGSGVEGGSRNPTRSDDDE